MGYVTKEHILAHVPLPELIDALDDGSSGELNEELLAKIIEDASEEADALVCSRYVTPFAEAPASIRRAAHAFAVELIYSRRRVPEEQNPFKKEANSWREHLRLVGRGERQLDAAAALPVKGNSGGNPFVPGRVPLSGSATNY
jgi:phage gp36-like protein